MYIYKMSDETNTVAHDLISKFGIEGAIDAVTKGITDAHSSGDNYQLSMWREVRRILMEQQVED